MNKQDAPEVAKLIGELFLAKGRPVLEGMIEVWITKLGDYPIDKIRMAFEIEGKSEEQFPIVGHLTRHMEIDSEEEALFWLETIEQSHAYHPDRGIDSKKVTWPRRAQMALDSAGGIRKLYDLTETEFSFFKRDFLKYFEMYDKTEERIAIADSPTATMIFGQVKRLN